MALDTLQGDPHLVILAATKRGHAVVEQVMQRLPGARLTVFSFREEPWEPPFLDALRQLVEARGHQLIEARNISGKRAGSFWDTQAIDLMLAISWRYLVPEEIFSRSRLGSYVFHDSLLPAYRGFSPTVWAMINGEKQTGATLLEMAAKVDTGHVVDQVEVPIGESELIASVMDKVTEAYKDLLERNLSGLLTKSAPRRPQDEKWATYCCKRLPEDNLIDWRWPARKVYNHIRALGQPYPGAYTLHQGEKLRIWSASIPHSSKQYIGIVPGRVVAQIPGVGAQVMAADGPLLLEKVQLGDGTVVSADTVLDRVSLTLGK